MKKDATEMRGNNVDTREKSKWISGIKPYDELEFRDDFMFGKVMQDKELCRAVLECLLQHPVGELDDPVPQREFRYTSDGMPIRLDIYTRDESTVYDAEIQNLNKKSIAALELPRRTRFYQASMDTDHMDRGGSYKTLPDSAILFICTFDPFGKGLSRYTFRGRCEEDREIAINDGAVRIFYNCCYKGNDIPEELKQFYDYVESGKSSNDLTKRIDGAVIKARKIDEWRSAYMKEMVLFMDARDEGRAEGREEGREEGRNEERKNTEAERKRADTAEQRAEAAEQRIIELEARLAAINGNA